MSNACFLAGIPEHILVYELLKSLKVFFILTLNFIRNNVCVQPWKYATKIATICICKVWYFPQQQQHMQITIVSIYFGYTYLCIYRHTAYIYGSKAEWLAKQEQKTEQKRLIHKKLNVKTHCYCSRNSASVSWITCNASNCHSPAPTSLPVAHTHTATPTRMQLSTYHTYAHTELSPFQIAVEVLNKWSGFW